MAENGKRSILRKTSYILGLIVFLLVIAGHASRFVHPDKVGFLPFFGMAFPVSGALLILLLGYWLILRSKMLVVGFVIFLSTWSSFSRTFQYNLENEVGDDDFKVMTYNVRLFDYYNWSRVGQTRDWIYEFLKAEQPDILCIQEFYHDNTGYFPTLDTLSEFNNIRHMHLENYFNISDERQWGMATLTHYTIVGKGRINFSGTYGNLGIFTDVVIDEDTVRIYNLHLQSVRFDHNDYKLMEDILEKSELEDLKKSRMLLDRMHDAWVKRASQAKKMAEHMKGSPYPIILCADMNDGPVSYSYELLSKGLNNSFVEQGSGLGNTYVGMIPFLRIDNIFHNEKFECSSHVIHPFELSDHHAVSATFSIDQD